MTIWATHGSPRRPAASRVRSDPPTDGRIARGGAGTAVVQDEGRTGMSDDHPHAIVVDSDFPGGNIIVDAISGDTITVHQDLRDTADDWFYWYFRVRGMASRTLTVQFTRGDVIGVHGPAVSDDGGRSWRWMGRQAVADAAFRYTCLPTGQ